jgi:ribose transport system substrate-binding protein
MAGRDPYLVKSVVHSSQLLAAFSVSGEALALREIVKRSGLPKSMAFRLLYTLEKCGMVDKVSPNLYRSCMRPLKQRLYRLGYCAQGTEYGFSREVSASIQRAAEAEGIELIRLDNQYNPKVAQRNADLLVREKVDLVIEFQTDENVAPVVAEKYRAANIPLIAIEIPHPGATYYGANNYEAGLIGGRYLGRWVKRRWESQADEIVLMELPRAGSLPRMRLTGLLTGLKEVLPNLSECPVITIDGDGCFEKSLEGVRRRLRFKSARRTIIGAINDTSALGALRAFQEAGRTDQCVILSHNASPEGRAELREPNTRLVGSVAYFPERYGEDLIRVSLDILNRRPVPPAVFVKHRIVTPENVDHYYPNDGLIRTAQGGGAGAVGWPA